MNIKSSKLLAIILIVVAMALALGGCGRSGERFANMLPTITITSYEGWNYENMFADTSYELPDDISVDDLANWADKQDSFTFQQRIYWHATDPDGVITGYAFRVLDKNRNPISTPGYEYISDSAQDDLTPSELLQKYGDGWAIHYMPGADQSFSLNDPEARRTIWTSKKYAVINFPAADENGSEEDQVSFFEVVAIDNRGGITEEAAWRVFRTHSPAPTCIVSTTKGNPAGKDVGSGLRLKFTMDDTDPFIPAIPYKFEFRMTKANADSIEIPGHSTDWISTDNEPDLDEFQLTRRTNPALTFDYENNQSVTFTMIEARATDMAGVVSKVSDALLFRVKPGFSPKTQIYSKRLLAFGDNHYVDYRDDDQENLPTVLVQNVIHFGNPFYRNFDGMLSAVHSKNLKVYVRWGWYGEYGNESSNGITYEDDDPYGRKLDAVLDRNTSKNYYSEITAFDLRYNDEPYHFAPFIFDPNHVYTDDDEEGKQWLRLPVNSPLLQSIVLTGHQVEPGIHKFEVRCVDLQDEPDPIPAVIEFEILEYIPPNEREGILILDDDDFGSSGAAYESAVSERYDYMFEDYINDGGSITIVNRTQTYKDVRDRQIAFSELMKYKMVIYHSDNPQKTGNLAYDPDAFALYLLNGGNILFSHTAQLASIMDGISRNELRTTMIHNLGLNGKPQMNFVSAAYNQNPFFQYAEGLQDYPRMDLLFKPYQAPAKDDEEDEEAFYPLLNNFKGLGPVAYFTENSLRTATPIYTYGSKPTDYPVLPPNETQYNNFHGLTVGIKNTTPSGGKTYTLGFPLSYMKKGDAKAFINKVLSEVMN